MPPPAAPTAFHSNQPYGSSPYITVQIANAGVQGGRPAPGSHYYQQAPFGERPSAHQPSHDVASSDQFSSIHTFVEKKGTQNATVARLEKKMTTTSLEELPKVEIQIK